MDSRLVFLRPLGLRLLASPYLIAEMPPGFDFDLRYTVTAYTFVTEVSGDIIETRVSGNKFTNEIVKQVQNAKKNKRVWFEDISVRGPDGDRNISSVSLKIN